MSSPLLNKRIYLEINTLHTYISEEHYGATEWRRFRVLTVCTARRCITARRNPREKRKNRGLIVNGKPGRSVSPGRLELSGRAGLMRR